MHTAQGEAWCWSVWALGSGNEDQGTRTAEVADGHRFRTVKTGGSAACGITTAGRPKCGGSCTRGQVGTSNVDR